MRIMRKIFFAAVIQLCFFSISISFSQDSTALYYSNLITGSTIQKYLTVLASDSLEGRETAQPGMEKAKRYVADQLQLSGLKAVAPEGYFQPIPLVSNSKSAHSITIGSTTWLPGSEYFISEITTQFSVEDNQVIIAGYGINDSVFGWNDFANTNLNGKIVMLLDGEPVDKKGNSLLTHSSEKSSWQNDRARKIQLAIKNKARMIIMVHGDYKNSLEKYNRRMELGRLNLDSMDKEPEVPVIYITTKKANHILSQAKHSMKEYEKEIAKTGKPVSLTLKLKISFTYIPKKTRCHNVLGFIEGDEHKDEVVVISAHLDHLGKHDDKIYYGADDDGSGSSSLLAMANAFAVAKKEGHGPARSILFIFFTGEEKGLLGSKYYTTHPVFPLKNTVADLNVDMIGRVDTITRSTDRYTYIIGSDKLSTGLHQVNETANRFCCNLDLDYRYNVDKEPLKLYYRSDHYNFAKKNIPVIFYFTGLHADYHKPTDTIDKIDFEKTAAVAKLVFNTAWELSNRPERITIDIKNESK